MRPRNCFLKAEDAVAGDASEKATLAKKVSLAGQQHRSTACPRFPEFSEIIFQFQNSYGYCPLWTASFYRLTWLAIWYQKRNAKRRQGGQG